MAETTEEDVILLTSGGMQQTSKCCLREYLRLENSSDVWEQASRQPGKTSDVRRDE